MNDFLDQPMPDNLFFVNFPSARTRREATCQYLASVTFVEPFPSRDTGEQVLHQITHPFSQDDVINRQIILQDDGKIRKSVRIGQSDLRAERRCLELIAHQTSVPVPRVYSFHLSKEFEHLIMEKLPGTTLQHAWPNLSRLEREGIADKVVQLIHQLRQLQSPSIEAAFCNRQPLQPGLRDANDFSMERMIEYHSCEAVTEYIREKCAAFGQTPNVFTHGDLDWSNIMVKGKKVCGIVDMESGGYFAPYWEWVSVKHFSQYLPEDSWFSLLEARLSKEHHAEWNGMWEVERLLLALDWHSRWALTPKNRLTNRFEGWAEVSKILGVEPGPPPEVNYTARTDHP